MREDELLLILRRELGSQGADAVHRLAGEHRRSASGELTPLPEYITKLAAADPG